MLQRRLRLPLAAAGEVPRLPPRPLPPRLCLEGLGELLAMVFRRRKGDNEDEDGLKLPCGCFEGLCEPRLSLLLDDPRCTAAAEPLVGLAAPPLEATDSCLKSATGSPAARSEALRTTFGAAARPRGFGDDDGVAAAAAASAASSWRPFSGDEGLNGSLLLPLRGLRDSRRLGLNGSLLLPRRGLRDSRRLGLKGSLLIPLRGLRDSRRPGLNGSFLLLPGLSTEPLRFALDGSELFGLVGLVGERIELRRLCFTPRRKASSCSSSAANCASASCERFEKYEEGLRRETTRIMINKNMHV